MGDREAGLFGERDELLDGVEALFVAEGLGEAGGDDVSLLAMADAACEQALPERSP